MKLFRRTLMVCMAWVWRKHIRRFSEFPWSLVQLADPRVSHATKARVGRDWDSMSECCVRKGVASNLKADGVTSADLRGDDWQAFLWWFAASLKLSVADVEVPCRKRWQHSCLPLASLTWCVHQVLGARLRCKCYDLLHTGSASPQCTSYSQAWHH
jgi:hypothetical protein